MPESTEMAEYRAAPTRQAFCAVRPHGVCRQPPQQQPARLVGSSELPTYTIVGQQRMMLHQRRCVARVQLPGPVLVPSRLEWP